jgi:hypothetical protein
MLDIMYTKINKYLEEEKKENRNNLVDTKNLIKTQILNAAYNYTFLGDSEIKINNYGDEEFMYLGITTLKSKKNSNLFKGKIKEALALNVCFKILQNEDFYDISIQRLGFLLEENLKQFGTKCSNKGKPFEKLLLCSLINPDFQNKKISELPFIKDSLEEIEIQNWMKKIDFFCKMLVIVNN